MATEAFDTFPKLLRQHAKQRGAQPAIREKRRGIWRTMTWHDLADEAGTLAAALSARGLTRGSRVGLIGDNRPRLYAAMSAAHWLGAVAVTLYQDATAEELAPAIQKAQITHVFAENQEQVDKILELLPRCPSVTCIVFDKDRGMRHYRQPQLVSYADLLQRGREVRASQPALLDQEAARGNRDDDAFVFFTSGTTGAPKGVVLSHGSLIDRGRALAAAEGLTDRDVAMAYLPPAWVGQVLFSYVQPLVVGHGICCPESSDTMLVDLREVAPSCFLATPRVLETLLAQLALRMDETGGLNRALYDRCAAIARRAAAGRAMSVSDRIASAVGDVLINGPLRDMLGLSRARVAYTAGDAIAPDLLMFYRSLGINLKQLYGSTETGFFVAAQRNGAVKPDSVGTPTHGVEVKVSPQREILVRSPALFRQYLDDPQATAGAIDSEGWYRTGDAGDLSPDGQLRVIDRLKNLGTLSDGSSFSPRMIENKLKMLPYVKEAVAFGNGRQHVCVLIDIDGAVTGRWADKRVISYTGHADLASRDEVYDLVADCIAKLNAELKQDAALSRSQIHRFAILQSDLSADDGLLTRTGKLKRDAIAERYSTLTEAMYNRDAETEVADTAGADALPAVKIRDVNASGPASVGRAA